MGCLRAGAAMILLLLTVAAARAGTIVQIQTSLGNIDLELFDQTAPGTVTNFLNYANSGRYQNTIIHRRAANFVIQGGGFTSDYGVVMTDARIKNEFGLSNVRGTIAMAKLGDNEDSATNQWFINLADNSSNLDNQNGGFTVFGRVINSGMTVADSINSLIAGDFSDPRFGIPPLVDVNSLPVRNYTQTDYNNSLKPNTNQLVVVSNILQTGTSTSVWQNSTDRFNVSSSSMGPRPLDAMMMINDFRRNGARELPVSFSGPLMLDVDGNKQFNSVDIRDFIQHLSTLNQSGGSMLTSFFSSDMLVTVPEPSTLLLTTLAALPFLRYRRRIRR